MTSCFFGSIHIFFLPSVSSFKQLRGTPVQQDYKIAPGRQTAIVSQITSVPVWSDTGGQGRSPIEDRLLSGQEDASRREYGPPVLAQ